MAGFRFTYRRRRQRWQKEQFEKNRLKRCNSITNEQAELEQGFIDQHLDKYQRMPTFLDAIEYGMRLQKEKMMKEAINAKIHNNGIVVDSCDIAIFLDKCNDGEEIKIIPIKEH